MISIICVYNNTSQLEECLLNSLKQQNSTYDLVLVNNTENSFSNAASALNYGAKQSKGEFLVFIHQDVILFSPSWIEEVEKFLLKFNDFGWAGVAGVTESGSLQGFLKDSSSLLWTQFGQFVEIQTLDEAVLICKRRKENTYFDEDVPGWHSYGTEACITSILNGKKNFVIAFPVWHNSRRTNNKGLAMSHDYLKKKFRGTIPYIYNTCGIINPHISFLSLKNGALSFFKKLQRFTKTKDKINWFGELMDSLTEGCKTINCYYDYFPHETIRTESFSQFASSKGKVINHYFTGTEIKKMSGDCIVLETGIFKKIFININLIDSFLEKNKVIVCVESEDYKKVFNYLKKYYNITSHQSIKSAFSDYGKIIYVLQLLNR